MKCPKVPCAARLRPLNLRAVLRSKPSAGEMLFTMWRAENKQDLLIGLIVSLLILRLLNDHHFDSLYAREKGLPYLLVIRLPYLICPWGLLTGMWAACGAASGMGAGCGAASPRQRPAAASCCRRSGQQPALPRDELQIPAFVLWTAASLPSAPRQSPVAVPHDSAKTPRGESWSESCLLPARLRSRFPTQKN